MQRTKKIIPVVLYSALIMPCCKPEPPFRSSYDIISPDGSVKTGFLMDKEGNLAYTAHYKNAQVVFPSLQGLDMQEGGFLGKNMELVDAEEGSLDETYPVAAGKSVTASLAYDDGTLLILIFKTVSREWYAYVETEDGVKKLESRVRRSDPPRHYVDMVNMFNTCREPRIHCSILAEVAVLQALERKAVTEDWADVPNID